MYTLSYLKLLINTIVHQKNKFFGNNKTKLPQFGNLLLVIRLET